MNYHSSASIFQLIWRKNPRTAAKLFYYAAAHGSDAAVQASFRGLPNCMTGPGCKPLRTLVVPR
jgi:hypothetical protein